MAGISAHLDTVAEAIWRADPFRMGDPDNWTGAGDQAEYRRMAQAAIDSLELTQEWAIRAGVNITRSMSENAAKSKAEMWPESFNAVFRLASPWVPSEGE